MPGPFPGVDPYLEAQSYWPDFQLRFLSILSETFNDRLPGTYEARMDERFTLLEAEVRRLIWIEVRRLSDRSVVTAIELLSPTNKKGAGRQDYLDKRNGILMRDVHLVELDLLVAGRRLPLGGAYPEGDYHAIIGRIESRPNFQVYSWSVRQPLPTLPIPLKVPDPDIGVDLAAVYATAYDRGRYLRSVDYSASLSLPLAADDRAWAEDVAGSARED